MSEHVDKVRCILEEIFDTLEEAAQKCAEAGLDVQLVVYRGRPPAGNVRLETGGRGPVSTEIANVQWCADSQTYRIVAWWDADAIVRYVRRERKKLDL